MTADDVDLLARRSLPGAWLRRWSEGGDRPVLFDDDEGWMTAGALEEESRFVAGRLSGLGLRRGDRLLVSAAPSVAVALAHVAALRLGLVVVPVNPSYGPDEMGHVVQDSSPAAALVEDRRHAAWIDAAARTPAIGVLSPADLRERSGTLGPATDLELDVVGPDDGALLLYTSGTTGVPKGALLTHGNLLASLEALRLAWRWEPDDRLVLSLPLFHLHGLGVGLYGTLVVGGSAVVRGSFDGGDVRDAALEHSSTMFFGVPTMYRRLVASGDAAALRPLRLCVSGSAPLAPELHVAVAEQSGQTIVERYGMTETVMNASNPYEGERRPGTVGFPLPGVEVRLDPATGEILLRGPNVFGGYLGLPDATAAAFDGEWFRSGDVGDFDDDGYLRIVGRCKELIISGGFNVYPREVEDVLRSCPGVVDAAVVGVPDPEWGERVVAYVEGPGLESAALVAFAAGRLAPYKRPRVVHVIGALPRNAMGKVQKDELGGGRGQRES